MSTYTKKKSSGIIKSIRLTARNGVVVDLDTYLVELNIHEDIFTNFMHGTLVVSDTRNLLREMPLEGEEFLYIWFSTSEIEESENNEIRKEFRVYNVTDRSIEAMKSTQMYKLHFVSKEAFRDTLTPLFAPFEGDTISEVVETLFEENLQVLRYPGGPDNELEVLDEAHNPVKFISPGWSPTKCINWLASKGISADGRACNFLFWETNKRFYFGSVERIFQQLAETQIVAGYYAYQERDTNTGELMVPEPNREFFSLNEASVVNTSDTLKLATEGDMATVALSIDFNRKEAVQVIHDQNEEWKAVTHSADDEVSLAIWGDRVITNPKNSQYYVPKNTHLFDEFDNNVSEHYENIFGKRLANLRDINNFKLNIIVQGRTDIQAGSCLYLQWPDTLQKGNDGWAYPSFDRHFSGYYLITAIRHKLTPFNYLCACEVVKDAFDFQLNNGTSADYIFEGDAAEAATQAQTINALTNAGQ